MFYGSPYLVFFPRGCFFLNDCFVFICSSAISLSKLQSIRNLNSKCPKQKEENLTEITFGEEHKLDVGPTTALSKGGRRELKVDSVLDNWNNYELSEYSL